MVFIRLLSKKYEKLRKKIIEECSTIVVSHEVLKEYEGRAAQEGLLLPLMTLTGELREKLENIDSSYVESKWKQLKGQLQKRKKRKVKHTIKLPKHKKDVKFVKLAYASCADCIISENYHLLELDPINFGDKAIRVLDPSTYMSQN